MYLCRVVDVDTTKMGAGVGMRVRGVWKLGGNLMDEAGAGVVAS